MSKAKAKFLKNEMMAAVHVMMDGLHNSCSIDMRIMREFDEACLAPAPVLSLDEIKAIREAKHVSESIFTCYFNVLKNIVSDSNRVAKEQGVPARRLLSTIRRNGLVAMA